MSALAITGDITIDASELEESFILASGPGGQNVNKVASAVQLRFDAARSPSLPEDVRARLKALAGRRLTGAGVIVVTARLREAFPMKLVSVIFQQPMDCLGFEIESLSAEGFLDSLGRFAGR